MDNLVEKTKDNPPSLTVYAEALAKAYAMVDEESQKSKRKIK